MIPITIIIIEKFVLEFNWDNEKVSPIFLRDGSTIYFNFYFLEGSIYYNIKGDGSVIQDFLWKGECNLLNFYIQNNFFHN